MPKKNSSRSNADPSLDSQRMEIELERKKSFLVEDQKLEMYNVTDADLIEIRRVFRLYSDGVGDHTMDCGKVPEALRALQLNPTMALMERVAGTIKSGEKNFSEEEFVDIYAKCRGSSDTGSYEDFVNCLQLWDRELRGVMPLADLTHALTRLGEKLNDEEMEEVREECLDSEDEDGNIPYLPFLARICGKPIPRGSKPKY